MSSRIAKVKRQYVNPSGNYAEIQIINKEMRQVH